MSTNDDFKKRLMATGRVANFKPDGTPVPASAPTARAITDEQIAAVLSTLKRTPWGIGSRREDAFAFARAIRALAPVAGGVPTGFDLWHACELLSAAAKSGDPGAMKLAAQLGGVHPCEVCGYVHFHCKCAAPASPQSDAAQPASSSAVIALVYALCERIQSQNPPLNASKSEQFAEGFASGMRTAAKRIANEIRSQT